MTTIDEFAKSISGSQYTNVLTKAQEAEAKELGFVVMYGYSDDCFELRGAIHDEFSCFQGGVFSFCKGETLETIAERLNTNTTKLREFLKYTGFDVYLKTVEVQWSPKDVDSSWRILPIDIYYAPFNIFEEDELFCIGAVVDIKDL